MAGPQLQININANVSQAVAGVASLGTTADHTFDEIAAGAAAMARIEAAINAMAAAALNAGHSFDSLESNVISTITPLDTLEQRLRDIREAIGRSATVQGAAALGSQYEVLNRTLGETRARVEAATQAAVGLTRAFNTVASSGAGLNRLAPAIRPALTELRLMPPAANAAAGALNRLRGSGGQAGAALTDFNRIVQDAPFGMVAIGNNITQLVSSFGNLQRSAGGTGAAFRALFSNAAGFGGISLIISAITTAVTFASVGFGAWTRGLNGSKKAADDLAESAKKLTDGIKSVAEVTAEAEGSTQGQIAQVRALASIITDSGKAYDVRKRALQELQQVNKNYFGTLKLEDAATGALTDKVNEYTKALVSNAVVKGFTDEIGRLSKEIFVQTLVVDKARTKLRQLEDALAITPRLQANAQGIASQSAKYNDLAKSVGRAQEEFKTQKDALEQLATSNALFVGQLQKANEEALKYADLSTSSSKASKKEDETLKALRKELAGYERQLKDINELRKAGAFPISQENDALALQLKIFDTLGKIDAREVAIKAKPELEINPAVLDLQIGEVLREFSIRSASKPSIPVVVRVRPTFTTEFSPADAIAPFGISPDAFTPVINAIKKNADNQFASMGLAIKEGLENTLTNSLLDGIVSAADVFGSAIGDIFSGAGVGEALANAASGFLGIIGGVLQEVGKQIVVTSTLVGALKRALDGIFGPGGEFISAAVGIALIGLGGVLKNIKFPGFAAGITSFAGGLAMVGEDGPELVRLPPGSDVINNRNIAGAGGAIILEPSIKFSGAQFQVMLNRVNQSKQTLG